MDIDFELMDIKWIRKASTRLGVAGILVVSHVEAFDIAAEDDPATDQAAVTLTSTATGLHINMQDTILGQEFVGRISEAGPRIEFRPTDPSSGSIVSSS